MQKKITHFNLLTVRPHCNIYPINKLHFYEIKEVGFVLNKINPHSQTATSHRNYQQYPRGDF